MNNQKLWTKDFIIVSLENFYAYFTYYLLITTITVFVTEEFHASSSVAGLAAGIFILGALFGRLFTGRWIDQVGKKKMLYIGFILFLVTTLLYFVVTNIPFLILLRIVHGAAFGVSSTAAGTIVSYIIPEERRGEGTGYYALSTTVASAIGPFLGIFLLQHASFEANILVCLFMLLAGLLGAFLLKMPQEEGTGMKVEPTEEKGFKLSNFFEPHAVKISIVSAMIGFGYSSVLSFFTSYSQELDLVDIGSFFFLAFSVATFISRPFVGRIFDQKGENIVMYSTFVLLAIGLIILSQAHQGMTLLIAGVVIGLGYGNFLSCAQAISIKVSPKNRMGLATSTFFVFVDGGIGVGPFILGFLIPTIGYRGMYASMAIVVLANMILYFYMHGKKAKARPAYSYR